MSEKRIYYSHAMAVYKSPTEDGEKTIITKYFPNHQIVDPGTYQTNKEKQARGMDYCFELVDKCDALAFSRILGKVTSGVGKEIEYALSQGMPVFELVGNKLETVKKAPSYLSREETRYVSAQWRKENISYRF